MADLTDFIPNRTFFWGRDNLEVSERVPSDSVDLIYLDPPFNSKRLYKAPTGSKAAGASFKDAWTLSQEDLDWLAEMHETWPAVAEIAYGAGKSHSNGMTSYLTFMAQRLIELHRVLKPTGSIYLHCDPTASHYLKAMMDSVFRKENFRERDYLELRWSAKA